MKKSKYKCPASMEDESERFLSEIDKMTSKQRFAYKRRVAETIMHKILMTRTIAELKWLYAELEAREE